jgi:hypothetical protein
MRPTGGPMTHTSDIERKRETTTSIARRRRGLRPSQRHYANHLMIANPMVHTGWPAELKGPVTVVHGGAVARVTAGRPTPTRERKEEGCSSIGEPRRTKCARWKGVRWSGEVRSTERKTLASSAGTPMSDSRRGEAYHGQLR